MNKFFAKRWKLLLVALVVLLVLVGMYIKKYNLTQKQYVTFSSPDQSFSLQHPRSWDVQVLNKGALVAAFITDERVDLTGPKPYINIAKGAVQGQLDDVYKDTLEKYKKLFHDVKIISETNGIINGSNAKKLIFDGTLGGKKIRYIVVVMDENGILYTITAASGQADSANLEEQVNKMLSTWSFKQ
jgi:hypothetical protein